MIITRRLKEFAKEVARVATAEENSSFSYDECIAEYTDQIVNDDYSCLVAYAESEGIAIPRALRGALK